MWIQQGKKILVKARAQVGLRDGRGSDDDLRLVHKEESMYASFFICSVYDKRCSVLS